MKFNSHTDDFKMKLIKKIFLYHELKDDIDLKNIWLEDLKKFNEMQIESAWNFFRKENKTKPKSYDLVRIIEHWNKNKINREKKIEVVIETRNDPLQRGRSVSEDILFEKIETMKNNTLDLTKRLSECKPMYEKFLLCAVALGKPNLVNEPFFKLVEKKWKERELENDKNLNNT